MSKGSLYTHFKSKEELQLNIFYYFSQMLEESIVRISQENDLTDREQFGKQLCVMLNLIIEYREFLLLQFREFALQSNNEFYAFMQEKTNALLEWTAQRIIDLYGQYIAPHAMDMALLLNGMLHSYMRFFVIKHLPFTPEKLIEFILLKLDHLAKGISLDSDVPLIGPETWATYFSKACLASEEPAHPLMILKEIRVTLDQSEIETNMAEEMMQSVLILEKELMELYPRRAIINGMIHNLRQEAELKPLIAKLSESLSFQNINQKR